MISVGTKRSNVQADRYVVSNIQTEQAKFWTQHKRHPAETH